MKLYLIEDVVSCTPLCFFSSVNEATAVRQFREALINAPHPATDYRLLTYGEVTEDLCIFSHEDDKQIIARFVCNGVDPASKEF